MGSWHRHELSCGAGSICNQKVVAYLVTSMPLWYQWAYLAKLVVTIVCRPLSGVRTLTAFLPQEWCTAPTTLRELANIDEASRWTLACFLHVLLLEYVMSSTWWKYDGLITKFYRQLKPWQWLLKVFFFWGGGGRAFCETPLTNK